MSHAGAENAESWSLAAAGWERHRDVIAALGGPVTARLVELIGVDGSETVLEIACGNGEVGLAVAEQLTQGRLIQTDLVPEMVAAARREAARRGLQNVDHRALDAEELDLPDGSIDVVVCRWGYMLTADPLRALAETRRALRPGGRVALSVWAERERNPWGTMVGEALVDLDLVDPPDPEAPGPFRLGGRRRLLDLVRQAALEPVVDDEVAVSWPPMRPPVFWETALETSTTLRRLVQTLSPDELDAVRRRVETSLSEFGMPGEPVSVPGICRVVLAAKSR